MATSGPREVQVFDDAAALSRAVAEMVAMSARSAVAQRNRFSIALAGGNTPRASYQALASGLHGSVPWSKVDVFFGDERCVPPEHTDSNYAMASAALLSHVALAKRRVHRIVGELPAADAVRTYERQLRRTFGEPPAPTFDVTLLGVGEDGHTASLFPGSPALEERERWVLAVEAPPQYPTRERITLTLPVFQRSREVWVLCAGEGKRAVASAILGGAAAAQVLPAARVTGSERTLWLLDRAAAPRA